MEVSRKRANEGARKQAINPHDFVPLQHPSYAVITKKFSYLLVKTGTLMMKARSDLRGYIPGQVIKLATEIHNKSGKDTGCVLASLIQVMLSFLLDFGVQNRCTGKMQELKKLKEKK